MDKQPTQEQTKEFWEWCGLKTEFDDEYQRWFTSDGLLISNRFWPSVPDIDLNNLFKYAIPKLSYLSMYTACDTNIKGLKRERIFEVSVQKKIGTKPSNNIEKDPALALFWAIWKVIHGS